MHTWKLVCLDYYVYKETIFIPYRHSQSPYEITLICCLRQGQRSISEADGPLVFGPVRQKEAEAPVGVKCEHTEDATIFKDRWKWSFKRLFLA